MCGIFSAISLSDPFNTKDYNKFKEATDLVSYRGPDANGYRVFKTDENITGDAFNLFFGHRRLSIIDLSDEGNQPMESNGNTIIYNGEIFNYLELRDELMNQNVIFKTNSDTEVILKIYEIYGSLGFKKLNGMWAFIIYDSNKKLIIASRDRFSIKPLFWIKATNKIYFASEIKQLVNLLSTIVMNKSTMNRFIIQGLLDINPETFYNGIERLEAKHNLIINLLTGKITNQKYWDYELDSIRDNEIYERFITLFNDSVRIRLRSDVELGALLSGGLDSSAISIAGRKIVGDEFMTFTVISDSKKISEEKFADIVTSSATIKNKKLLLASSTVRDNFDKVLYYQDEPFAGFSMIAQYSILEKIKNETNIIVVLSGQGGDEVLLGYLRYFFFNLKKLYTSKRYISLIKEILGSLLSRTILLQWKTSAAKRYLPNLVVKGKSFILDEFELERTWDHSNLSNAQSNDIDKYSIPILTRYEDRNSMAHSLETRLPFLDHRLVEFLLSLDVKYKIKNGWNKYILRDSFSDLPASIRWRRDKKGFSVPEGDWLKYDFKDDILFNFKKSLLEEAGLINGINFIDYYKDYLAGNSRINDFDISRVYIAEKWMKKNFS